MNKLSMSEEEMLKRKYTRPYEKRIAELEKENAELKEELEEADNATDCFNRQEEIITKAKEIIKTILGFMQTFGYSPSMDKFIMEAEQFISEVEK